MTARESPTVNTDRPSVQVKPAGPFCQSCGMPLTRPEDFGTGPGGYRINDYCGFCYRDGTFTEPEISLQEMIDRGVGILAAKRLMTEAGARALLTRTLPKLQRWSKPVPEEGSREVDDVC